MSNMRRGEAAHETPNTQSNRADLRKNVQELHTREGWKRYREIEARDLVHSQVPQHLPPCYRNLSFLSIRCSAMLISRTMSSVGLTCPSPTSIRM